MKIVAAVSIIILSKTMIAQEEGLPWKTYEGAGKACTEYTHKDSCSNFDDWRDFSTQMAWKGDESHLEIKETLHAGPQSINKKIALRMTDDHIEVYEGKKKVGNGSFFITTDFQSIHLHFTYQIAGYTIDEVMVFTSDSIMRNGFISDNTATFPRTFWQDSLLRPVL